MLTRFVLWLWKMPLPWWLRFAGIWLFNPKFVATTSAVVLNERNEVLLFHHTYRGRNGWSIPGGWLKRNEEPARAVEREIYEESGLVVRTVRPLWVGRDWYYPGIDMIFLCSLEGGQFRPSDEVSGMEFRPTDCLPELRRDVIEIIHTAVREHGTRPAREI
jgi:ADP-ribose pyrophosphatase YjhB (NUDIX family)